MFNDILEQKKTFLGNKNKKFKKCKKIEIFPKGLTHDFGQKMPIFPSFFRATQDRKISFTIF